MPTSGSLRFDYTRDENLTIGEARLLHIRVRDEDGIDIANFAGWQAAFFVIDNLNSANGLTALAAAALVHIVNADIDLSTPPYADVSLTDSDWPATPRTYWYEFWRVDAGNETRLAYGSFAVIP